MYLLYKDRYKNTVTGWEIYYSIFKSKQKKKVKKIILGDSVGNQLFPNTKFTDTINSLACNQSIGVVGQYCLLNNYINAGNEVDTVYMMYSPFSFQNNLDQVFTYHYFLKPFYTDEYKPLFTETVNRQVDKIPFHYFCRLPFILTSNWAPDFTPPEHKDFTFLAPISVEYLNKIKELGAKHHFELIILAPPTSLIKKPLIDKMDKAEIAKSGMSKEFGNYFESIIYLDDNYFLDNVHLKKPQEYTSHYLANLIK